MAGGEKRGIEEGTYRKEGIGQRPHGERIDGEDRRETKQGGVWRDEEGGKDGEVQKEDGESRFCDATVGFYSDFYCSLETGSVPGNWMRMGARNPGASQKHLSRSVI